MSELSEFVGRIVQDLDAVGIPYMIVGSLASSAHGSPRFTHDVDVVIAPTADQLAALVRHFQKDFYADLGSAMEALRRESMFNIIDFPRGLKADFILLKRRPFDQMEFSRRVRMNVAEVPAWAAAPEDVILSKLEWSKLGESERQYRDAMNVAAIQRDKIDVSYLHHWAVQLGVSELLNRLLVEIAAAPKLTHPTMPPSNHAVYLDNHATTRVDPRVVEAMLPYFGERFGNAGSTSHRYGWEAREAVDRARESIAVAIGAQPREIIFTSGATESNNLALRGVAERARSKKPDYTPHLISLATEHKAVLDPLEFLANHGCRITLLPVEQAGRPTAGLIAAQQVSEVITDNTVLVSVMLANNEIGAIQPIAEIGAVCRERGVLLHCDATQAVGKVPVNVDQLQVDLLSFSAHKIYGPKGIGALFVRRRAPVVKLEPQIFGGGQENGFRSGTANVPGIVGFGEALDLCLAEMPHEQPRLAKLRNRLYDGLIQQLADIALNGPSLDQPELRLAGNLNVSFGYVDGEALLLDMQDRVAASAGSACTSANPQPSHVLRALGYSDDLVRSSLRFGLGRFNTSTDVETAIEVVSDSVNRLRKLSSMA